MENHNLEFIFNKKKKFSLFTHFIVNEFKKHFSTMVVGKIETNTK